MPSTAPPSPKTPSPKTPSLKVYVLRLENNKWYIGSTTDVATRFQEHKAGKGSVWTRIHKPVKIEKVFKNVSPFEEDKVTKEYMSVYGMGNVRGGSYCQEVLDDFQRESIQRELWMAEGACFVCGRKDHFSKACRAIYDVTGRLIGETLTQWLECGVCGKRFASYKSPRKNTLDGKRVCEKCISANDVVIEQPRRDPSPDPIVSRAYREGGPSNSEASESTDSLPKVSSESG